MLPVIQNDVVDDTLSSVRKICFRGDIYRHHRFHPDREKVDVKDKGKGRAGALNICEN